MQWKWSMRWRSTSGAGLLNARKLTRVRSSTPGPAILCSRWRVWMVSPGSDSKVHGANMGPIWGRQDPGGPHVGPMNLIIWGINSIYVTKKKMPSSPAPLEIFTSSSGANDKHLNKDELHFFRRHFRNLMPFYSHGMGVHTLPSCLFY